MQRTIQIDRIIHQRRPLAERVRAIQGHLRHLESALRDLHDLKTSILDAADPDLREWLRDLDLETQIIRTIGEIEHLDKLRRRFDRPTINIGVIGRARQGKSRLLQSLSGLSHVEIPDGDLKHCTGVRSTIYHNPSVEPYAEVHFYSEREFLREVIAAYYADLDLGPAPESLAEFSRDDLPEATSAEASAVAGEKYRHLRRYQTHLDAYRHLLDERAPRRIDIDAVRTYVAQEDLDGQPQYTYLAVRDVKIICEFPHQDVGQIAMIDMPGLGDTGLGDQERMLNVLSQDVDFVFFVRMPKNMGDHIADYDVALYDLARRGLGDLPIEQWSLMVLNRTQSADKGDNLRIAEVMRDDLQASPHIRVIDTVIADCADPEAAGPLVLDRALDYMVEHIQDLDAAYASARQDSLLRLHESTRQVLDKAAHIAGNYDLTDAESELFDGLFDQFWADITRELEQLVRAFQDQRHVPNPIFEERIAAVLDACEHIHLPTLEDIDALHSQFGAYNTAYDHVLHVVRNAITREFSNLDDAFRATVAEVKAEVAGVLIDAGHLGHLVDYEDGGQFLADLDALMGEDLPGLKTALHNLYTFEISYRAFILYRIRAYLDDLNPDLTSFVLVSPPSAQQIHDNLEIIKSEVVYHLREAVEKWLPEPNAAAFAVVEEFADQVLRADQTRAEWRRFFRRNRAEIWPQEFQQFGVRARIRNDWQHLLSRAAEHNQPQHVEFI